MSRKGISGSVKGLWRTCDVFFLTRREKKNNITCGALPGNGRMAGGVVGGALNGCMYDVPTIRLLTYLLLRGGCFIFCTRARQG